jgi:hypothetical protein
LPHYYHLRYRIAKPSRAFLSAIFALNSSSKHPKSVPYN